MPWVGVGVDGKLEGGAFKVGELNETWEVTGRGGTEGRGLCKVGDSGGGGDGDGRGGGGCTCGGLGTKCAGG